MAEVTEVVAAVTQVVAEVTSLEEATETNLKMFAIIVDRKGITAMSVPISPMETKAMAIPVTLKMEEITGRRSHLHQVEVKSRPSMERHGSGVASVGGRPGAAGQDPTHPVSTRASQNYKIRTPKATQSLVVVPLRQVVCN